MASVSVEQLLDEIRSGKPDRMMDAYNRILEADGEQTELLLRALEDNSDLVRWAAASILGELQISGAISALRRKLEDDNLSVRIKAAQSLLKYGDTQGIPVLLEGLGSNEVMIGHPPELASDYANQVLRSVTGEDFGFKGDSPESERLEAVRKWESWWREAKDRFRPASY